eukprot:GHVQ01009009.1.p1 GENE.GHVQ01009009.1~~GHVQ01009009.1.p1  ORF type:complete len:1164 (+),score=172.59 GHVQ01009009.1:1216-4707(+)
MESSECSSQLQQFKEFDKVNALITDIQTIVSSNCDKPLKPLCTTIAVCIEKYQELPAVLDSAIPLLVTPLLESAISCIESSSRWSQTEDLLHVVYIVCKTRGYKCVVRSMPHECHMLEPLLDYLQRDDLAWSSRYAVMLWLSLVVLTPFKLNSIDSSSGGPDLLDRLVSVAVSHLSDAGKERDGAAVLLAKLMSRHDIHATTDVAREIIRWFRAQLRASDGVVESEGQYKWSLHVGSSLAITGVLQAVNEMLKHVSRTDLQQHLEDLFGMIIVDMGRVTQTVNGVDRKLRLACACRIAQAYLPPIVADWRYQRGARMLNKQLFNNSEDAEPTGTPEAASAEHVDVPSQVDDVVEALLTGLRDKETIVRWAAAKGIGRVVMRLPIDFGEQVLDCVLELFSPTNCDKSWQGGCLALAELTRRGLLVPARLPQVVPLVVESLQYDVRQGAHTVGAAVRDAACYVCWAFARAYAASELKGFVKDISRGLVQVSVFDREVNCRRAASAAIQEHVGRQGQFPNGIDLVTITDYFNIATTRNAYLRVAPTLSDIEEYGEVLIDHLVKYKLKHPDLDIRQTAASSLSYMAARIIRNTSQEHYKQRILSKLTTEVLPELVGECLVAHVDVESRQGALLAVTALIKALQGLVDADTQKEIRNLIPRMEKARMYCGKGGELTREAACRLIESIGGASGWEFKEEATGRRYLKTLKDCLRHFTTPVQIAAAEAAKCLALRRLSEEDSVSWCTQLMEQIGSKDENVAARRGYILATAMLPPRTIYKLAPQLITILCSEICGWPHHPVVSSHRDAQARQYAVVSLMHILHAIRYCKEDMCTKEQAQYYWQVVVDALCHAMQDYEYDSRGDVGSWVREVAIEVTAYIFDNFPCSSEEGLCEMAATHLHIDQTTNLYNSLLTLCFDKLDRTRARALFITNRLVQALAGHHIQESISSVTRPSYVPFQACWVLNRIHYAYCYELPLALAEIYHHNTQVVITDDEATQTASPQTATIPPDLKALHVAFSNLETLAHQALSRQYEDIVAASPCSAPSKDIASLDLLQGGAPRLQKTKSNVCLRLPVWVDAVESYRCLLTLLHTYTGSVVKGIVYGSMSAVGSVVDFLLEDTEAMKLLSKKVVEMLAAESHSKISRVAPIAIWIQQLVAHSVYDPAYSKWVNP